MEPVQPDARERMEALFDRARVKMVENVRCDARGSLVIQNGFGGMPEGDLVRVFANRDFGSTDLTNVAQETVEGDRLLIFGESDLGVPAQFVVRCDYALERVRVVVRDRRVLFIDGAPEGAGALYPLVVLPRLYIQLVVFGTWDEVEERIRGLSGETAPPQGPYR